MTLPDGEPIPFAGWVKEDTKKGTREMNKEWQYLTDDEIKEIVGSYGTGASGYGNGVGGNNLGGYTRELFNKIEAKIREKNETNK